MMMMGLFGSDVERKEGFFSFVLQTPIHVFRILYYYDNYTDILKSRRHVKRYPYGGIVISSHFGSPATLSPSGFHGKFPHSRSCRACRLRSTDS